MTPNRQTSEWTNILNEEWISDASSDFGSNLKLTESGYRNGNTAAPTPNFVGGHYWSSSASNSSTAKSLNFDAAYNAGISSMTRGYAVPCRCVKN